MNYDNPLKDINLEEWRRKNGSIRMADIFEDLGATHKSVGWNLLRDIEQIRPIHSEEVAMSNMMIAAVLEAFAMAINEPSPVMKALLDTIQATQNPKH